VLADYHTDNQVDVANASFHPHSYIKPIGQKWFYLRQKPNLVSWNAEGDQ